ncbi:unnamed protein product, partial [Linum tenue]
MDYCHLEDPCSVTNYHPEASAPFMKNCSIDVHFESSSGWSLPSVILFLRCRWVPLFANFFEKRGLTSH